MPRSAPLVRATLMGFLLTAAPVGLGIASTAHASDVVPEQSDDDGPSMGAIIGACCGVLFGGALALWQIRGMKDRR